MATAIPQNSVWSAMNYPPPKGRCNYKTSLMSPACPCLRFMLHPVKAATSFECDGCNHHASFHSLENPTEDAIIARWGAQEAENRIERQAIAGANKKRKRIADKPANEEEILGLPGVFEIVDGDDTEETVDAETEEEKVVMVAEVKKGSATGRARNGIGIGVRKARGGGTATTLRGRKT